MPDIRCNIGATADVFSIVVLRVALVAKYLLENLPRERVAGSRIGGQPDNHSVRFYTANPQAN